MAEGIFMGTVDGPLAQTQFVACPQVGVGSDRFGYVAELELENGGGTAVRSFDAQRAYTMAWTEDEFSNIDGLLEVSHYQEGHYGDGLVYVSDPFWHLFNMFRREWGSPALIELGYKNFGPVAPTFSDTTANSNALPARQATWDVSTVPQDAVAGYAHTLLIPPGHTLHLGFTGAVTGDGAVRVLPIEPDGTEGATVDLTPLLPTDASRLNQTFSGDTYHAVRVYLTNAGGGAGTVTIAGLMAQISSPTRPLIASTLHIKGEGACGMMFVDTQTPFVQNRLEGMFMETSATLKEIEWWR